MTTIRLPTDFKKFLRLLNSGGVEYLVVGGYAVAFHGHPRSTGDLDIWIATSPQNVARVRRALTEFGFSEEMVASAPLHLGGKVIRIGRPPLRIKLLTTVSGVEFDDCYRRRESHLVEEVEVAFISRGDLLANKRAAGLRRPRGVRLKLVEQSGNAPIRQFRLLDGPPTSFPRIPASTST